MCPLSNTDPSLETGSGCLLEVLEGKEEEQFFNIHTQTVCSTLARGKLKSKEHTISSPLSAASSTGPRLRGSRRNSQDERMVDLASEVVAAKQSDLHLGYGDNRRIFKASSPMSTREQRVEEERRGKNWQCLREQE